MMQSEFEKAVGIYVSGETFDRINEVYMECEFFTNKDQLYNFYKHYDMNGIERMYQIVIRQREKEKKLKRIVDLEEENSKLRIKIAAINDNWNIMTSILEK